jgi:hypothetical protein
MKNHASGDIAAWRRDIDLKNIRALLLKNLGTKIYKLKNALRNNLLKKIDVNGLLWEGHLNSPFYYLFTQNAALQRERLFAIR